MMRLDFSMIVNDQVESVYTDVEDMGDQTDKGALPGMCSVQKQASEHKDCGRVLTGRALPSRC